MPPILPVDLTALTPVDWDDINQKLTLHHKRDEQLQAMKEMYAEKIPKLEAILVDPGIPKTQEDIDYIAAKIARLKEKAICVDKEIELRVQGLVERNPIGTTYYLDFNCSTANLTGTCTFTNASTTVSGTGTLFTTELAVGNYIRVSNGTQWYKVTGIASDTSVTIAPAFQQATVTDAANSTKKNSNAGTSTTAAFAHIEQYTTDTARAAGDILKVRANQTHVVAGNDIDFDEDGTANSLIEVQGCSTSDDPWGDASDVKPVFDFSNTAYSFYVNLDDFWRFFRLGFKGGSETSRGNFFVYICICISFESCDFHGEVSLSGIGCFVRYSTARFKDCSFYGNGGESLYISSATAECENCTFNGGAYTTDYGVYVVYASRAYLKDCTFGATTAHDLYDIYLKLNPIVLCRNCSFTESKVGFESKDAFLQSEDHQQTKGANKSFYEMGTVEKDTTTVRSGGASSSAKMSPNANCGLNFPLKLTHDWLAGDFRIWCPASATTVTVYILGFGWTTFPTASELYIQAEYWDSTTSAKRALSTASTQVLTDNTTWVGFTTSFTPVQAGWAYVKVYLKKYTADCGVYVDVKPVVS